MAVLWRMEEDLPPREMSLAKFPVLLTNEPRVTIDALEESHRRQYVLLTSAGHVLCFVNGKRVPGGIQILSHQDEISVNGQRFFFSTEERAQQMPFPSPAKETSCARCRARLETGQAAVHCSCGLWYHQTEQLPCWTYSPKCVQCTQVTQAGGDFQWVPEDF